MRIIDADKFEVFTCVMPEEYRKSDETIAAYSGGMDKVLEAIDAAPTIDPESLRPTAKLIVTKTAVCGMYRYKCSSCGALRFSEMALHINYCSNCGKGMVNADE